MNVGDVMRQAKENKRPLPNISPDTTGMLLIMVATISLSTEAIAAKIAYREGANVITTLSMRYLIAAVVIWAVTIICRYPWRLGRRQWAPVTALSLGGHSLSVLFLFYAFHYIPAAMAVLLLYVYPSVVTILAYFYLKEPVTWRKLLALLCTMAGCVIILSQPVAGLDMRGVFFALTAAVINAVYLVCCARLISDIPVVVFSAYITGLTAVFFLLLGSGGGKIDLAISAGAWQAIIFLALVCTVLSVIALFQGVKRIGASRAAIISTFEPVSTTLLGMWLLQETLSGRQLLGGVLILAGVMLQKRE